MYYVVYSAYNSVYKDLMMYTYIIFVVHLLF